MAATTVPAWRRGCVATSASTGWRSAADRRAARGDRLGRAAGWGGDGRGLGEGGVERMGDGVGLGIGVCHFPRGTSKWNKIEHRMFCHITRNWRGRPLTSRAVVVNLIGGTTTAAGLQIHAALDEKEYPTGTKVTDAELARVRITKNDFHGEWNYAISPHPQCSSYFPTL